MVKGKRFHSLGRLLLPGFVVVGVGYGGWWWLQVPAETPEFQTAKVVRGDLTQSVSASGQLSPVLKVQVGSQISGIIQKLFADFNSPVKEGQVIAQLDPATYRAFVLQAEGNLASAKAALELVQLSYQRSHSLRKNNLVPQSEEDQARADLHQAEAAVKINEGNLEKAKVDLARCTIYSPIDGIVISRNVDVGQTVAASLSAPTLFFIANDLTKMQIEAHVTEADIGRVEVGQEVKFTVDAFPEQGFGGKVVQIRNAPTNDQNVVSYDTIIEVSNRDSKLRPGMTANVSIIVARRENALKMPNAALRFRAPAGAFAKESTLVASVAYTPSTRSEKRSDGSGHKKDKRKSERTVYVLSSSSDRGTGNRAQAVQVKTGVTDGSYTEALDGLKEGDELLTGMTIAQANSEKFSSLLTGRKKKR